MEDKTAFPTTVVETPLDTTGQNNSTLGRLLQRLECPIDADASYRNDAYTNRDLIPTPRDRRTWGVGAYTFYWVCNGVCLTGWATGATLLAYGLAPGQAVGCVAGAGVLTGLTSVACGWPGTRHRIGFTVLSRASYGVRGAAAAVVVRAFSAVCWFGVQAYFGGACAAVAIGALWPRFLDWEGASGAMIPASAHITPQRLIGLLAWYVGFCALAFVAPERLVRPFAACTAVFLATCVGVLAWAVTAAGGAGTLWTATTTTTRSESASLAFALCVVTSSWATGMLGQSDVTRYARSPNAPLLSQLLSAPLFMVVGAVVGIVATSAAADVLDGEVYWEPYNLLAAIQAHYDNSSGARAGVFFAALGCCLSQMALNVLVNSISMGMDVAGLCPRWINIRRGQFLCAILGVAICPWQLLASADTFLTFLNGFGVILAPMMGLQCADYLVVRRRVLDMDALYSGRPEGAYWYAAGFNWRGALALLVGFAPCFPGLVMICIDANAANGWVSLYSVSMIAGFFLSGVAMVLVCLVFPPKGLGVGVKKFVGEDEDEDERSVSSQVQA